LINLRSSIYRRRRPLNPEVLRELGVAGDSAFARFYERYEGPFSSSNTGFCLLDVQPFDALGSVLDSTMAVRRQIDWPDRFLVLTDMLCHGVYVYDTASGKVFNVDFEGGHEELVAGELPPAHDSFEDFLAWYFEGEF
jgi:hypothetical protein